MAALLPLRKPVSPCNTQPAADPLDGAAKRFTGLNQSVVVPVRLAVAEVVVVPVRLAVAEVVVVPVRLAVAEVVVVPVRLAVAEVV
ncbi:hypothetical protein ACX80O_16420, partial [Arthrobacter sp. Hz1]